MVKGYIKPNEATFEAHHKTRFEQGNKVDDLTMGLFCQYVEMTTFDANLSHGIL